MFSGWHYLINLHIIHKTILSLVITCFKDIIFFFLMVLCHHGVLSVTRYRWPKPMQQKHWVWTCGDGSRWQPHCLTSELVVGAVDWYYGRSAASPCSAHSHGTTYTPEFRSKSPNVFWYLLPFLKPFFTDFVIRLSRIVCTTFTINAIDDS